MLWYKSIKRIESLQKVFIELTSSRIMDNIDDLLEANQNLYTKMDEE